MSPTKTNQKKYAVAWVALVAIILAAIFASRMYGSSSVSASEDWFY